MHLGHDVHDEFGGFRPLFPVFYGTGIPDHLLDIPSVFGYYHLVAGGVVFHGTDFEGAKIGII
jgi:hypothetical protein